MTEDDLRKTAAENGIEIADDFPLPLTESVTIETDNGYVIGLDRRLTGANKKAHLAHEMGHAIKGAVYRASAPLRTRSRCEYRARKWMYETLLPLDKLESACLADLQAPLCDIADSLDVPETVLRGAIRHYEMLGLLVRTISRGNTPVSDRELSALRTHTVGKMMLNA